MVTEVKSGCLRNEHDNVDEYGDQLVVGGQQGILNRGRAIINEGPLFMNNDNQTSRYLSNYYQHNESTADADASVEV